MHYVCACQMYFSIDEIDLELDEEEISDDDDVDEESDSVHGVMGM